MFNIYLTSDPVVEPGTGAKAVYGKIQIDDWDETFSASQVFWTAEQYQRHWAAALRRIVEGENRSALITSYIEPMSGGFLNWWPLYREGDTIYIQNQMLFFDQLKSPFCVEYPWESVSERKTTTAEGTEISEWTTTVSSLQQYLQRSGLHQ